VIEAEVVPKGGEGEEVVGGITHANTRNRNYGIPSEGLLIGPEL
jgi:hypothetical protein